VTRQYTELHFVSSPFLRPFLHQPLTPKNGAEATDAMDEVTGLDVLVDLAVFLVVAVKIITRPCHN